MIDRYDAPEGTKAYLYGGDKDYGCHVCHFNKAACPHMPTGALWCSRYARADCTGVVFMTPEEHRRAKHD